MLGHFPLGGAPLGGSASTGAINGTLSVTEANDALSAIGAVALKATASITEATDTLSSAATLLVKGTGSVSEAGDTLSSAAALLIKGVLSATEAWDTLSAASILPITGTLSAAEADDTLSAQGAGQPVTTGSLDVTEADDSLSAAAALAVTGTVSVVEAADTLAATATIADAPPAPVFVHVGGDDPRLIYERKQREWQESLRRIIDQAWRIANGEIDPVTLQPIPPPDLESLATALELIQQARDQAALDAFVAEEASRQEEEAIAVLLLAA